MRADEPAVPNLAEAPIDLSVAMKQAPISNANLVKVMVPMLVRQLISPNQRDAATNVVQLVVQSSGAMEGSRDELVDLITAKVNQLKEKPISVSQFNEKIASIITAKSPLPPALQASVDAALEDVRATWGDATLQKMSESLNWGVSAAIKKSSDFIDGEHLSAFIKEKAVGIAQHTLAEQAMTVAFESINYKSEITTASLVDSFMEDFPAFAEDLKACANRAEVDQLIENHTEDFITFASFYKTKETIVAQAKTRAVNMLAENVGLTPEQAQSKISFNKLDSTFSVVSSDFHCGATAELMRDRNITLSADDTQVVISTLLNRHSELTAVTSSADLTAQLESYKADIAAIATSYHALSTAWAEGVARVTPAVAAAIGKSEDYVRENLNTFGTFEGGSFTVKRARFNGIINNPNTALADMPSPETIHAEFKAIIDKFVDGKKAAFEAVDTLPVPESHKENLRQIVLKNPRIFLRV